MEWQPIETADINGRTIIGFNGIFVSEIMYVHDEDDEGDIGWCYSAFCSGGSLVVRNNIMNPPPTHWQPLPEPPKE